VSASGGMVLVLKRKEKRTCHWGVEGKVPKIEKGGGGGYFLLGNWEEEKRQLQTV